MRLSEFGKKCVYNSFAGALSVSMMFCATARADDADAEKQKLSQCEKDICSIIVGKKKDGPDLTCDITKTWKGEDIQKGAAEKHLSWGLGQTQCTAKIDVKRGSLVEALTSPAFTLKIDKQSISCDIGSGGEKYPVKLTIAPELKLKDGKATNAALHIDDIEGAKLIKGVVWTAAALEQNLGLFEGDLVREINRFIDKECPKKMSEGK